MKIVIIEDMDNYRERMGNALEAAGHEVHLFSAGSENFVPTTLNSLIKKVKALKPDRILIDHDLRTSFTGADVVAALPKGTQKKCISISSDGRDYCENRFSQKQLLPDPAIVARFVEVVIS